MAGLTVALVLIPQSMAYAELAGLPPHIGLFASALPPIFAAFAASSPYLQTGPVALTSLLTFGALAEIAEPGSIDYVGLATLLALPQHIERAPIGVILPLEGRGAEVGRHMLQGFRLANEGASDSPELRLVRSQAPTLGERQPAATVRTDGAFGRQAGRAAMAPPELSSHPR